MTKTHGGIRKYKIFFQDHKLMQHLSLSKYSHMVFKYINYLFSLWLYIHPAPIKKRFYSIHLNRFVLPATEQLYWFSGLQKRGDQEAWNESKHLLVQSWSLCGQFNRVEAAEYHQPAWVLDGAQCQVSFVFYYLYCVSALLWKLHSFIKCWGQLLCVTRQRTRVKSVPGV